MDKELRPDPEDVFDLPFRETNVDINNDYWRGIYNACSRIKSPLGGTILYKSLSSYNIPYWRGYRYYGQEDAVTSSPVDWTIPKEICPDMEDGLKGNVDLREEKEDFGINTAEKVDGWKAMEILKSMV